VLDLRIGLDAKSLKYIGDQEVCPLRTHRSATAGFVAGRGERDPSRERIVCNKTKAIRARRCNTISINAGTDRSQNSQRAERTLVAAKSPAHESLCAPVLLSAPLNRWLAVLRRISQFVARLAELREADRPMAR
jgi:hypothetical protein